VSGNPVNLVLRFALELAGLAAFALWGWTAHQGTTRFLWAFGLPALAAAVWGIFRVPDDGGPPVVTVPGWVRLLIEAVYFCGATAALVAAERRTWGIVFAAVVVAHYLASYDRVARLLRSR
jgi:hypothetical protein